MATFSNQATLSYNGQSTTSNVVTGEIIDALSVTKTAVNSTYTQNGNVTYVISLVNSGATPITNLTLEDNLGAYTLGSQTRYPLSYVENSVLYYSNSTLQATPSVTAGPPLVITGINVPANGNATIIYETDITQYASPTENSSIVNTVSVSGASLENPVTASETVTAARTTQLSISKSVSPSSVSENGSLTYTFVIQNTGNTATNVNGNAIVTDTFNPILHSISVTLNQAPLTSPANYTYNALTGEFATVGGVITVPAATYTQDPITGIWTTNPGIAVLTVTGTI